MTTVFPQAFLAHSQDLQDRIDSAFYSVAYSVAAPAPSVDTEPLIKKQKLINDPSHDGQTSPTENLRISISSIPRALQKLDALPYDDEFLTRFYQELGLEIFGGYTQHTQWRETCAIFVEKQSRRIWEVVKQESSYAVEEEVQPDLDEQLRDNANELLQTRDKKTLPPLPALDTLSITDLVAVAKTYISEYPYDKECTRYWPSKLMPSGNPSVPTDQTKAFSAHTKGIR
ncbi:hypothetical protein BT96DRAFT_1001288 [Gymnopus androsaceus JB14]|uniref:Uncharacterized protein n=1 Tax=Gymnopus androsaceus JB14 TaxID=1447944 RepID=A0A6A4H2D7_9AGAR|nr:hypothetical protein BT96DRAFT_1001288 [Gymnopus androsaceus JB14]